MELIPLGGAPTVSSTVGRLMALSGDGAIRLNPPIPTANCDFPVPARAAQKTVA